MHLLFCILLGLILLTTDSALSSESNLYGDNDNIENSEGKTIRKIDVTGLSRADFDELIDLIGLKRGNMLDRKELSAGIRRAFRKGIFLDIKTVSEPFEDGVSLKYIVIEVPVISRIRVSGNTIMTDKEIRKIFLIKEGDDFREELLGRAKNELAGIYRKKGFHDAKIDIIIRKSRKPSLIDLNLNIQENSPSIIKSIDMDTEVRSYFSLNTGDIFDQEIIDKDIKRLLELYKKRKYINPEIGPYTFIDGVLSVPVIKGPRLQTNFNGNSSVRSRKIAEVISFLEEEDVSDETVEDAIRRIQNLYLDKGYYYVHVAAGVERKEDNIDVSIFIIEGKKVILKSMRFEGASISDDKLKKVVRLQENKPYSEALLESSIDSLESFYRALGFIDMKISETEKDFSDDGSDLYLKIAVDEGSRTSISSINVTGNIAVSRDEILRELKLYEGSPYNTVDIRDARYRLLSLYRNYGYLDASVNVDSRIEEEKAALNFIIEENSPYTVGKIILRGNKKTKSKIIWREFFIEEGDSLNLKEIVRTKQRLYKLGLFRDVTVDLIDSGMQADGRPVKDVLVSMHEGKAGSVEFGVGYGDYEKMRGSLNIRYNNLGGYNRQIGLKTELSSVEQRYVLNFTEPWLFNEPDMPLNIYLMKENRRAVNIDTDEVLYKIERTSLLVDIEKKLSEQLKTRLNYEYSFVDTKDVDPGVVLTRDDIGRIGIGSISPSVFYDTRDNPFNPSSGSLNGIVLKFASSAFLSDTEFIKGSAQSSWFFPLMKGTVFAISFKGGAAYSFDDNKELPLVERFFLGGRTTVRGYSQDTLGPKSNDGTPTGGNIFALANTEFRIPIGKGFGLVTFLDAGNVWTLGEDIATKMKYTAGAGLRYKTPVGPLRVDYGHKLDRDPGESAGEVHFSFGHAF